MKKIISLLGLCLFSVQIWAADAPAATTPAPAPAAEAKPEGPKPAAEAPADAASQEPVIKIFEIGQTVLKMSLKPGVSAEDAIASMMAKAVELNMRMVGHLHVSDEMRARGVNARRLEILQFCNPEDAVKMVEFNPIYAAYMPCRIAMVEDEKGMVWLMMLNLDMIINKFPLPEDLRTLAITVNGQMLDIITAGSTGDF